MAFLLFVFLATVVNAQSETSDLAIDKIFKKYKKDSNSSMVVVRSEDKSDKDLSFNFYKSIEIEDNEKAVRLAQKCLEKDKKKAKSVKEIYSDGELSMVYLKLKEKRNGYYRFILFTSSQDSLTLIYLELGNENLLKTILKKK